MIAVAIGAVLAIVVAVLAAVVRLDQARAFYPAVLVIIASYYLLFAVIAGDPQVFAIELALFTVFAVAAAFGVWRSLWIVVVALLGHGVMDAFHGGLVANPGVPQWWPAFCAAYDVLAAAGLAFLLLRDRGRVAA